MPKYGLWCNQKLKSSQAVEVFEVWCGRWSRTSQAEEEAKEVPKRLTRLLLSLLTET